jgi:hypothetical protein
VIKVENVISANPSERPPASASSDQGLIFDMCLRRSTLKT